MPIEWQDDIFVPFDYGYFAFVYNHNKIINPPKSMEELINRNDISIVIQDPRTSTVGLGLLTWIKSLYGNQSSKTWNKLSKKIIKNFSFQLTKNQTTIIDEIKRAKSKHPHISTILFHDDSFLALRYETLEEFCKLYKEEVNIPFCVYGIIPNYVREDKIALLLDAGMNRVRMGIQSGSDNILEFYKRPTKLRRIKAATKIFNKYKKFMLPPNYDIILENPVETTEDTRATVDMIYEMPRPFTLNIFALRIIPNTQMAKDLEKRGIKIPEIDADYFTGYHRTMGNALVFTLCFWKIPKWLYKILRKKIYPTLMEQPRYPILFMLARTGYMIKRYLDHMRLLDFTYFLGKLGYYLSKFRIVKIWQHLFWKRYHLVKQNSKIQT